MSQKQITKKSLAKKRKGDKRQGHFEGKHWCDCLIRNIRKWFYVKRNGHD